LLPHQELGNSNGSGMLRDRQTFPDSNPGINMISPGIHDFTFTSVRNWGEDAEGTWIVRIFGGNTGGTANSLTLDVYGTYREEGKVLVAKQTIANDQITNPLVGDSDSTDDYDAYAAANQSTYQLLIDGAGAPNTFTWVKDGVTQASGVPITGLKQPLGTYESVDCTSCRRC
jgi:hypothetical protein